MSQKLTPTENTVVGISSGTIEVMLLQPILYWKNASQQGLPFTLKPSYLYRGLAMSVTNMAVLTGVQFPLTGAVTRLATGGEDRRLSNTELVGTGFVGGALSGIICAPMELVMIQQQKFGSSLFKVPGQLVAAGGVSTMFRGLITSCGREGLFCAGYMGMGPGLSRELEEGYELSPAVAKVAGAIGSALVAGTLSHPMDTIKTCMQGDVERSKFTTLSGTARTLYAENGAVGFFRGWHWRTMRMTLSIIIMGQCKDVLSPAFFPHAFE